MKAGIFESFVDPAHFSDYSCVSLGKSVRLVLCSSFRFIWETQKILKWTLSFPLFLIQSHLTQEKFTKSKTVELCTCAYISVFFLPFLTWVAEKSLKSPRWNVLAKRIEFMDDTPSKCDSRVCKLSILSVFIMNINYWFTQVILICLRASIARQLCRSSKSRLSKT